ncbi:hypothetical protein A1O1_04401 [Capronia coronata CBS 617.96]|uniref:ATP-binding protein n=1 Tax=Capronia coronata CBS 617.96 TaxID=1182541 RepID=W9YPX1_9EURO|nr:uncharacterized protein A1O1_04401 [Capronia coronata CBS 617.96]EXJ91291.1 hypothetical protein A1O1_04401 [Capronia coronata CBS 617.96]
MRKCFSTCARVFSHENPLGLPRSSASSRLTKSPSSTTPPPQLPRLQRGLPPKRRIPHVSHTIAVSSAKGGVGKSTLAVNLALAFSRHGLRTGILDTDIFGPSIPTLLNLDNNVTSNTDDKADGDGGLLIKVTPTNHLVPLTSYGIKSMSMGYLLSDESSPVAWRGLMVMKALQQLLWEVDWGQGGIGLDVLVLDMPPGTGDTQLTIGQQVELDGAVVVSTPQDIALKDAVKGLEMFRKMKIPVLGVVQNMSVFVCPHCGTETRIFAHGQEQNQSESQDQNQSEGHGHTHDPLTQASSGGLQYEAGKRDIEFLGDVPLDPKICADADRGMPTIVAEEAAGVKVNSVYYERIAETVAKKIGLEWT